MAADIIQAQYEQLDSIANRFGSQAESNAALMQRVIQGVQALQQSGWEGQGATAFFAEMETTVFPITRRLTDALEEARMVTLALKDIIRAAEEEAAHPFSGNSQESISLGTTTDGNAGNTSTPLNGPELSGPFRTGSPQRPDIKHDNGFLDQFSSREPTFADRANLLKWRGILEVYTEATRPDLADATAAYRHFLDGNGTDRNIDYERFLNDDPSGRTTLRNLLIDAQRNVEVIGQGRDTFKVTSDAYNIGGSDARFPYPETENWEKALGGHNVWTSANVQVTGMSPNRTYTMEVAFHMEDRYNFNPGQSDIATGIPDSDNGVFEITGLAHQYMNYGQVTRVVSWQEGDIKNTQISDPDPSRNRRPSDNRRVRNQI